jgi:hypothetical protein
MMGQAAHSPRLALIPQTIPRITFTIHPPIMSSQKSGKRRKIPQEALGANRGNVRHTAEDTEKEPNHDEDK